MDQKQLTQKSKAEHPQTKTKTKNKQKQQKENPTTPMVFILQKNICHQKLKRDI